MEKIVNDEQTIRQFLKGMYGARGPNGELAFDPEKGVVAENLPKIGESKLLHGEVSNINHQAPARAPYGLCCDMCTGDVLTTN